MSRFIDMDKLVLPKGTVNKIQEKGVPAILDWLAEQESIEVVRCKDCKYRKKIIDTWDTWYYCGKTYHFMSVGYKLIDDDFFCADGEREKTDEPNSD